MESPVVYLSVSSHQGSDSDSSLDNCDEDETPESRDYVDSMHGVNVNVKKPKGFGRWTIIVSSLVLLLLAAVAVGMMLLLNQETPSGVECHLQSTIYTSRTTVCSILYCTVLHLYILTLLIVMFADINFYVSKYHTTVVTTELSAYLYCTFQLS